MPAFHTRKLWIRRHFLPKFNQYPLANVLNGVCVDSVTAANSSTYNQKNKRVMKKLLLMAVMAVATLGASASDWYAGGQVTFGRTTDSTSGVKTTQVTVLPELGYNLSERFAVGSVLGVSYRKSGGEEKTVFQINPYARYTYLKAGKVNLFVDGCVDLGIGRAHGDTAVEYGIGLRPGVSLNLTEHFSLVAHVGFLGYQSGNDAAKRNGCPENWGLNLNSNNLMFGFYYSF
jgi:hypothetical protein